MNWTLLICGLSMIPFIAVCFVIAWLLDRWT